MHFLILALVGVFLLSFPSFWIKYVLRKHGVRRDDLPGTGAELAIHLLKQYELHDVVVEETEEGRHHYDPGSKAVRLGPSVYHEKSLCAVAIAAHEVGHAIQFERQEIISVLRGRYQPVAQMFKKAGILMFGALPFVGILLRAPSAMFIFVALGILLQLIGALMYLIVLPEEWDASFGKALPILSKGEYVQEEDIPAVRRILKAAAFTYFAGALSDLVNIGRWLLILRR